MAQCASVKKRGSQERCTTRAILNSEFCGRHSKMKQPTKWVTLLSENKVTVVQSVIRGWLIRRYLKLAGPGVLRRSGCVNDEEMVTFEDKTKIHPFEYFGWEENGKVWWMSIASMGQLTRDQLSPANPYTKVPFSIETRSLS